MSAPQVMMIHSDRPLDEVREDLKEYFNFVPQHVFTASGYHPIDPKSTQRFVSRSLIEAYYAGRTILIHNTDVPGKRQGMTHMQVLVLIYNSWGYLNIPTELKQLEYMEALEVGVHDPSLGKSHYVVTRKPSMAKPA